MSKTKSPLVRDWIPGLQRLEPAAKKAREESEATSEQPTHAGFTGTSSILYLLTK
jgi:hypothetical protein